MSFINDNCIICWEKLGKKIKILPCDHIIHITCNKKLSLSECPSKHLCPICLCPIVEKKYISEIVYNSVQLFYGYILFIFLLKFMSMATYIIQKTLIKYS